MNRLSYTSFTPQTTLWSRSRHWRGYIPPQHQYIDIYLVHLVSTTKTHSRCTKQIQTSSQELLSTSMPYHAPGTSTTTILQPAPPTSNPPVSALLNSNSNLPYSSAKRWAVSSTVRALYTPPPQILGIRADYEESS